MNEPTITLTLKQSVIDQGTPTSIFKEIKNILSQKKSLTPEEIFEAYLTKNNLKKTPERFAVLREIMATNDKFTISDIFDKLENKFRVSNVTINHTLQLLIKANIIRMIGNQKHIFKTTYFEIIK